MVEAETLGYSVMLAARSAAARAAPAAAAYHSHSLTTACSLQRRLAFSDYGEQAFVLAQNLVLLLLIYRSSKQSATRTAAVVGAYAVAVALYYMGTPAAQYMVRVRRGR